MKKKKSENLSAEICAHTINVPIKDWPGNCHFIANQFLQKGIVKGKLRYGHFLGDVKEGTMFYKGVPFVRHGWIELEDGRICDPTRWVFEGVEPYVYVGPNNDEYDIGGSKIRDLFAPPMPMYDEKEIQISLDLEEDELLRIHILFGNKNTSTFSISQIFWLANRTPPYLATFLDVKLFYIALEKAKLKAAVPIDYWTLVMKEGS
ncbi:MAG: hypothetical protein M0R03_11510 [Novosphingobium sp.]|nr:hypothetical protein [Novosphingobium sp.]